MKHETIGPTKKPDAVVATYRTRKIGTGDFTYKFKTVILSGTHECVIVDWKDQDDAIAGHNQIMARLARGEPIQNMAN